MIEARTISPADRVAAQTSKSRARLRYNQAMKWVRRAHLYAGLFLTPWVFLYGVSAVLFNHPGVMPDQPVMSYGPNEIQGTGLERPPVAAEVSGRVVESLNKAEGGETPAYRLVRPEEAGFNRDVIATVKGGGKEYTVRLSPADGTGTVREVAKRAATKAPFATKAGVKLDPPPFETVTKSLPDVFAKLGLPAGEASVRSAPDLAFFMEGKGQTWKVNYNAQTGQVSGRPEASGDASPGLRRSLLLMHVGHGFPSRFNARWVWAVAVDAMGVCMVGWGFTGLLMWWQMKNVRRVGLVVLVASLLTAAVLAFGMHAAFVSEGLS